MKKLMLLFSLSLGMHMGAYAFNLIIPDTLNKKPIPIHSIVSTHILAFTSPSSSTFSILIESNGNIVDIDEVSLSLGDVHTIDMSTLPNGNYRVLITDITSGIEYEYFYRKDDDFVTI